MDMDIDGAERIDLHSWDRTTRLSRIRSAAPLIPRLPYATFGNVPANPVSAGDLVWVPSPERVADANVTHFTRWLKETRGLEFAGYPELWEWSITDTDGFWQAIWDYNDIVAARPPAAVLGKREMPGAEWFPGAELNYAQNVLAREKPGEVALYYQSETIPLSPLLWDDFAGRTRILATRLRSLGVRPGDRVASYLPNVPEAVIAMLAATGIGAIWTSVSPDFGWRGTLDRFRQLEPTVLLVTGGYTYGGKDYHRGAEVKQIIAGLPSVRHVVYLPFKDVPAPAGNALIWDDVLDHPPVKSADFEYHQGSFGMPLWILFSSGATGLPKAITHSHGGILLEQLKLQRLNMDLGPGDVLFFHTTTGWMMWNFLVSSPLIGVKPLLYDGNPGYPEPDALWRMADEAKVTMFGASPAYVDMLAKRGVVPREKYGLQALKTVMCAGSPVSPEVYAWFLRNVKRDLYLHVGSGGTDVCSGFTGGSPTLPTHAGEHTHRNLGVAAFAFDSAGETLVGEVGEMVITKPMPSMPVKLWGDDQNMTKYQNSYFDMFPGVWRQGDFFKVTRRGSAFVLGRSDATLNRGGVRIGTAEVYSSIEGIPGVDDAIVVNLDLPDGKFFMPMFVKLTGGLILDGHIETMIKTKLRREYTPRHAPDKIIQVPLIPTTLTGKKLEVPVRRLLMGVPLEKAANTSAMADPSALDAFIDYARTQQDYRLLPGLACHRSGSCPHATASLACPRHRENVRPGTAGHAGGDARPRCGTTHARGGWCPRSAAVPRPGPGACTTGRTGDGPHQGHPGSASRSARRTSCASRHGLPRRRSTSPLRCRSAPARRGGRAGRGPGRVRRARARQPRAARSARPASAALARPGPDRRPHDGHAPRSQ
jgi:acetoacetyl-CoA synthetase